MRASTRLSRKATLNHFRAIQRFVLRIMVTVLLSIFAHGLSAMAGIGLDARKIASLAAGTPERLDAR